MLYVVFVNVTVVVCDDCYNSVHLSVTVCYFFSLLLISFCEPFHWARIEMQAEKIKRMDQPQRVFEYAVQVRICDRRLWPTLRTHQTRRQIWFKKNWRKKKWWRQRHAHIAARRFPTGPRIWSNVIGSLSLALLSLEYKSIPNEFIHCFDMNRRHKMLNHLLNCTFDVSSFNFSLQLQGWISVRVQFRLWPNLYMLLNLISGKEL